MDAGQTRSEHTGGVPVGEPETLQPLSVVRPETSLHASLLQRMLKFSKALFCGFVQVTTLRGVIEPLDGRALSSLCLVNRRESYLVVHRTSVRK